MKLNSVFKDWLYRRRITDSVITDFNLESDDNHLTIPVYDSNGSFIFNKYRRSPLSEESPKYWYDKGGRITLFAYHKAKEHPSILITEGEMDALVAWSSNIPAVTSTGGAVSFQEDWKDLFDGKEIFVCFDNDRPGGEGMYKVWKILPKAKLIFLPDTPGIKDISDYVTHGGDLHDLLRTAVSFAGEPEVMSDRAERLALWKSTYFHEAFIKYNEAEKVEKSKRPHKRKGTELETAKSYPITNLIRFTQNKAKCLWHNEKTASLHYFPDNNRVYCFGCGKSADSIDVAMKLHNCTFLEAIKALQP